MNLAHRMRRHAIDAGKLSGREDRVGFWSENGKSKVNLQPKNPYLQHAGWAEG